MAQNVYHEIVTEAMLQSLGVTPRAFQLESMSHIIKMNNRPGTQLPIRPSVVIQCTGSGKTSLYQTIGIIKTGVSLIIQNTLALSSDQMSKLDKIKDNIENVYCIQLDSLKSNRQRSQFMDTVRNLQSTDESYTMYIFTSPETLTLHHWSDLIQVLMEKKLLKFICVDEVHQFIEHAVSFRPTFLELQEKLFKKILDKHQTTPDTCQQSVLHVPIVFMSATFNERLFYLLQKITKFHFHIEDVFWSEQHEFKRRNIDMTLTYSQFKYKSIKSSLENSLKNNIDDKAIIYSNVAAHTERIQENIDRSFNESDMLLGDTLLINGEMDSEWKFVSSQSFTTSNNGNEHINNNKFYPRFLIATSACIGAGLDSNNVKLVVRDGFPCSLMDFIQEMGRCGRGVDLSTGQQQLGTFDLIISIDSFIYLVERIFEDDVSGLSPTQLRRVGDIIDSREILIKDRIFHLLEVIALIYLPGCCWHLHLERVSVPPYRRRYYEDEDFCGTMCPFCNGSTATYILPLSKQGMIEFLVDTFITNVNCHSGVVTPRKLVLLLTSYPDVSKVVYKKPANKRPPLAKYIVSTVLQLIGSQILHMKYIETSPGNKEVCLYLNAIDIQRESGEVVKTMAFNMDMYWNNFKLIVD